VVGLYIDRCISASALFASMKRRFSSTGDKWYVIVVSFIWYLITLYISCRTGREFTSREKAMCEVG